MDKVDVEEAVAHKARVQADAEVDAGMSPPEHLLRGLPLSGWAMHTAGKKMQTVCTRQSRTKELSCCFLLSGMRVYIVLFFN